MTILFFSREIRRFIFATAARSCALLFATSQFLSKRLPSYTFHQFIACLPARDNHRGTDQGLLEFSLLHRKAVPPLESDHVHTPPIRVAFNIAINVVDLFDLRQSRAAAAPLQTQHIIFARSAPADSGVWTTKRPSQGGARGPF